jgi:Fic family protein
MIDFKKFATESNQIEGEKKASRNQVYALQWFIQHELTEKNTLEYHRMVAENLPKEQRGVYRKFEITIGGKPAGTPHYAIQNKMDDFFRGIEKMDSWEAHNLFEKIHGFSDYNGRTGRAIWLWKFLNEEGGKLNLSFLHRYYYQALQHCL